jgi:predicted nucleic acid-binding protein
MLVVDASCLVEVLTSTPRAEAIRQQFEDHVDLVAPHLIDVEVMGVVRRRRLANELDDTSARQALMDLAAWSGERFPHAPFIGRAWQLRENVRTWDAFYVALAERLDAPLLTLDTRLARASGIRCEVIVPEA